MEVWLTRFQDSYYTAHEATMGREEKTSPVFTNRLYQVFLSANRGHMSFQVLPLQMRQTRHLTIATADLSHRLSC